MNLGMHRRTAMAFILAAIVMVQTPTQLMSKSARRALGPLPERQIDLGTLNYRTPVVPNYADREIFSDLSLLFQDVHAHVEFVSANELVVYFSDVVDERVTTRNAQSPAPEPAHTMQAIFVDVDNGKMASHQIWQTRRRRFFNGRYDTQARIMPMRGGFLVHAANTLTLYSPDLQKKQEIQLDASWEYAAMVAPGGEVFFLERSMPGVVNSSGGVATVVNGDSEHWPVAHGEWRSSETFEKLRSRDLFPGAAMSVSTDAFAGTWFKCVDIQRADLSQSHLCCGDPCRYGAPLFLDDREVVMEIRSGFQVLSTSGEVMWGRQNSDWNHFDFYDYVRSLDGSRFAMSLFAYHKIKFDDTEIPKRWFAILVYDRAQRTKVFSVVLKSESAPAIALSPDGERLAVLSGTTLFLYKVSR